MTTWISVENIMLSEVSQTERDRYCMVSLICGFYKSQIHSNSRMVVTRGWGWGKLGDVGQQVQTSSCYMSKFWSKV